MYDESFFADIRARSRSSAAKVVPYVVQLTSPASVIDVGCGTGSWLAQFVDEGITDVLGIDGPYVPPHLLEISSDHFSAVDLSAPVAVGRRFDLALCLEVVEHLTPDSGAAVVRLLTDVAPVVLFSAAAPHQGGTAHVNEQWPSYWAELFASRGYVAIDCLRRRFWHDDDVEWWFAQNMVMYADGSTMASIPELAKLAETWGGPPPALVHPRRFLEWVDWGIEQSKAR